MHEMAAAEQWARSTFGGAELGDARRRERLVKLAASLAAAAGASPAKATGNEAGQEGAYRFLRNDEVSPQAIAEAGFAATAKVASPLSLVLAVEDTTTLSYRHAVADELGDLGGAADSDARGYFVHSALLLDAETGASVGLAEHRYWMRETAKRGQRHRRRDRAYRDKESFKWQQTSERLRARLGDAVMASVISVCDREADVYEYMHYKLAQQERFVVRACWDRALEVKSAEPQQRHLFTAMEQAPSFGTAVTEVPQRGGRTARTAHLTVRAARLSLRRPNHADPALARNLEVNTILAIEDEPPAGVEPLCWLLLTTESIANHEDLRRALHYYRLRWRIEEFHKAWKSGAGVEERRLQSATNIERLAVILAFIAVRLLQLREFAQALPDEPCDCVLPTLHWKVLWATVHKKRPPIAVPTLKWALTTLGRLGGWKDTKRTGRVGWEAVWDGWFKLQERVDGYLAVTLLAADQHR
jgi:hypothetical protein